MADLSLLLRLGSGGRGHASLYHLCLHLFIVATLLLGGATRVVCCIQSLARAIFGNLRWSDVRYLLISLANPKTLDDVTYIQPKGMLDSIVPVCSRVRCTKKTQDVKAVVCNQRLDARGGGKKKTSCDGDCDNHSPGRIQRFPEVH
jgi:hypothetical protein